MSNRGRARLFVGYATEDRAFFEAFEKHLAALKRRGLVEVWHEGKLVAGELFAEETRAQIDNAGVVVLLVSANFVHSDRCWEELLGRALDRQTRGLTKIVPVLIRAVGIEGTALADLRRIPSSGMPIGRADNDPEWQAVADEIERVLGIEPADEQESTRAAGKLHGVPELPPHFLARQDDLGKLRAKVLGGGRGAVGLTGRALHAGVQGMGGIGKSVLAAALARDPDVRDDFPDGVFWVALGQTPMLVALQKELCRELGANDVVLDDKEHGKRRLTELLANRACLVVLDDAWDLDHVTAFGETGPQGRVLVTTRDTSILTGLDAAVHNLDLLADGPALALLASWAGQPVEGLHEVAREVARECGNLPLALAMIGASVVGGGPEAWRDQLEKLQAVDLAAVEQVLPNYPYPSLFRAFQVSIDALSDKDREHYLEFAVFPEDTLVPRAVLETLWMHEGLKKYQVGETLRRLVARSLMSVDEQGRYGLHDLQRDYLVGKTGEGIAALHGRLLEAYAASCPSGWASRQNDGYYFVHLAHHLKEAGRESELRALLLDADWLSAKLQATDVAALLADFTYLAEDRSTRLVEGAIRLSAHVLSRDKQKLAAQLHGRLADDEGLEIQCLLARAASIRKGIWLRPRVASFTRPGGPLVRTLEGHSGGVNAVAVTADGQRAVSGSYDGTLKVWDLRSGDVLLTLEGHSRRVHAVAVTADGQRAVSGSLDRILKVWDLRSGKVLLTLEGHSGWVRAVAVTADGKLAVSGSWDTTLKVWDLRSGKVLLTLEGHSRAVTAVVVTADGQRAVSGSLDRTLKVWDLRSGKELHTLKGHSKRVTAVAATADGQRAVSGSYDRTLKVWDLRSSKVLLTLEGHSGGVQAVAVTADGQRAVSGSLDRTLKVWDVRSGKVLFTLERHSSGVRAVTVTADGKRAVSGSWDATLKVWDVRSGKVLLTLAGHSKRVTAVAVTADGQQAVSGSSDDTLKVWDLRSGKVLLTLKGHSRAVDAVAVMADGQRAVSGSWDATLKVWDLRSGKVLLTLKGHSSGVRAVTITADGQRAVSGSDDTTLKVWDLRSGKVLLTFEGHSSRVHAVAVTADGKLAVSGSADKTLKVWDLRSGNVLLTLEGHSDEVTAVAVTTDGKLAVSGSAGKTLKVWDLSTGKTLHTFYGEAPIRSVAVTPDGRGVVAGDDAGRVHFFSLEGL